MTAITVAVLILTVLFAAKAVYALSVVLVLPKTRGALYVSTSPVRISAALDAVPMTPRQVLVDLGCGDGRLLKAANQRYGIRAVGYEINLLAYLRARVRTLLDRRIEVRLKNFWLADLSDADVIFCYLFPDVLKPLVEKIRTEVKPGAVVVSANFPLPGMSPQGVLRPEGSLHGDPIFVYRL